jgi:hypothetical protein
MQGLQSTANQQLSLLNAQLNAASQNVVTGQTFHGRERDGHQQRRKPSTTTCCRR